MNKKDVTTQNKQGLVWSPHIMFDLEMDWLEASARYLLSGLHETNLIYMRRTGVNAEFFTIPAHEHLPLKDLHKLHIS